MSLEEFQLVRKFWYDSNIKLNFQYLISKTNDTYMALNTTLSINSFPSICKDNQSFFSFLSTTNASLYDGKNHRNLITEMNSFSLCITFKHYWIWRGRRSDTYMEVWPIEENIPSHEPCQSSFLVKIFNQKGKSSQKL